MYEDQELIVVIDGVCVMCNNFAKFVVYFNPNARLMWAQNPKAIDFLRTIGISFDDVMRSIVVVRRGVVYRGSDGFIQTLLTMNWFLQCLAILIMAVPKIIREYVYNTIASNRYSLFGKTAKCAVPSQEIKSKFLHPL